jgi:hypothetical protein
MLRKTILLLIPGIIFLQSFMQASPVINLEDHPAGIIEMKSLIPDHMSTRSELKKLKKEEHHLLFVEKQISRISQKLGSKRTSHSLGGFSDPVDKWFWIWIVTWGLGILLTILFAGSLTGATFGIIWLLSFGLGAISLVLWLVKKFGG